MRGSLFNLIIVLIPLSIFIGRTVLQARAKARRKQEPPRPAPVRHEDADVPHWERAEALELKKELQAAIVDMVARGAKASPVKKTQPAQAAFSPSLPSAALIPERDEPAAVSVVAAVPRVFPANVHAGTRTGSSGQGRINLDHLSPMQQAVVMAEILGSPKGIGDR